jgi:hypothetical protein
MAIDGENRLWVERFVAGQVTFDAFGGTTGARLFEVYSAKGELRGEVRLPAGARTPRNDSPIAVANGRLYMITVDDDDIPHLVCFRIVAPAP